MDDDLEDKIFYQTYVQHVKLLSRVTAVGLPAVGTAMAAAWRLCRSYLLRPDVFFLCIVLIVFVYYLQAVELWSRGWLDRISSTFGTATTRRLTRSQLLAQMSLERNSWQLQRAQSACYAVQGRRNAMEDRYVIDENVNNSTGVALFAIFDGHGGDYAAEFAKTQLIDNISAKIVDTMQAMRGIKSAPDNDDDVDGNKYQQQRKPNDAASSTAANGSDNASGGATAATTPTTPTMSPKNGTAARRSSFKKSYSTADDCGLNPSNCNREQDAFLDKLNSIIGAANPMAANFLEAADARAKAASLAAAKARTYDGRTYLEGATVNFGKLIVDEVLAADDVLNEQLQKRSLMAGTTALMAIIHRSRLIVANVGDSRGVMCDSRGNAIPLSFDHKPQQVRERKRIQDAGGFIAFKGVWRVAGILATSRALGDFPLKLKKKLVTAQPDILSFDLQHHKPQFLILATDGLWDTFSNEEAVAFIRKHLHEPLYGAKSLTHQAYQRGSVDNISVLVIAFKNDKYYIGAET